MVGLRYPYQRHGGRGVAYDGAVTSRAEIIRHAMRLGPWCRPASYHASRSGSADLIRIIWFCARQAGGGSTRDFGLTGAHTRSILVARSYPMSGRLQRLGDPHARQASQDCQSNPRTGHSGVPGHHPLSGTGSRQIRLSMKAGLPAKEWRHSPGPWSPMRPGRSRR